MKLFKEKDHLNKFISIKYIYINLKFLININLHTQQTNGLNFHTINFSYFDNLITNTWNFKK